MAYKAYKAYKAFMAFKRSRLNPFQTYSSTTPFSVDWPRTIRLLYEESISILSVCTIKLQVIVNQNHWTSIAKTTTPEQIQNGWQKSFIGKNLMVRQVARPCPCMTTSIIINITPVISMWTLSPSVDHSWLSWCWGPNGHWVLLRNFSILWGRKKKWHSFEHNLEKHRAMLIAYNFESIMSYFYYHNLWEPNYYSTSAFTLHADNFQRIDENKAFRHWYR